MMEGNLPRRMYRQLEDFTHQMQTTETHFLLNELLARLPVRGQELLQEICDHSAQVNKAPITGAKVLEQANESQLVFCRQGDRSLIDKLLQSRARVVVTEREIFVGLPEDFIFSRVFLLTEQPRLLLAMLLAPFEKFSSIPEQQEAIHPSAQIASDVILARGVMIGPNVTLHAGCVIGPNTVINHASIGVGSRIGPNCTIGKEGFGFEVDEKRGSIVRFPHFGSVHMGKGVEIGANVTIDRGSLRDTLIEDEVKIDNLVYVAHNCHIKRGALIMANTTLLGSVTIGEYAWIAPSTSILNGMNVGRCGMTGLGSVVVHSVGSNELVVGSPARKLRERLPYDSPLLTDRGEQENEC